MKRPSIPRPRLVSNWRQAYRMASVNVGSVAITFGLLPEEKQAAILAALHIHAAHVPALLGAVFIVSRLVAQRKVSE